MRKGCAMTRKSSESDEGYLLDWLKRYGVKEVKYRNGSPQEPPKYTSIYLDHLDKYAIEVLLGHPGAPRIKRLGERFVLERREKKRTTYKSIRSILKKLLFELAMKDNSL